MTYLLSSNTNMNDSFDGSVIAEIFPVDFQFGVPTETLPRD